MIIHKFIVHVLDKNSDVPILNDFEGKINPEVDKFFQKIIKRVTKDDDLRKGVFKNYNDNVVRNCCEQIIYDENTFLENSKEIAAYLFDIMKINSELESCDLAICLYTVKDEKYVAILKLDYKKLYKDTQDLLDQLGLQISPKTPAGALNSGQLQLMSIVRAMAAHPKIMVLDEPTTALTDSEVDILMNFLENLRKSGVSCIYISHKLEEIFRICDRVTIIRDGNVITSGDISEFNQETLVQGMIGRKVENMYVKSAHQIGEPTLEVKHLSVPHPTIDNRNIVDDISFSVRKGEILGIGGLVGAGRSEALGAIFGELVQGVHKEVKINGKEVTINSPKDAIKAGIGFVTEERKRTGFIQTMNILHNLSLISLYDLPKKHFIDRKVENEKAKAIFDRMRVKAPSMNTMVVNLSGGNQQKVVLGKWLMKNPQILFIDEPTKGIDVGAKAEFYKMMDELAAAGVSIVMVSSDMPELMSMSDRILVLSNGKITGEFSHEEAAQATIMKAAIANQ